MSGLLFSGGTLVSAEGSYRADVLVEDEKIVAVGANLDMDGAETVDASGKLVMEAVTSKDHFTITVGHLRKGVYMLKLYNGYGIEIKVEKIVVL